MRGQNLAKQTKKRGRLSRQATFKQAQLFNGCFVWAFKSHRKEESGKNTKVEILTTKFRFSIKTKIIGRLLL